MRGDAGRTAGEYRRVSAVLHSPPEKAVQRGRPCPECMCTFVPAQQGQLFCSAAHRQEWNNRATVRGRVLTPLAIVARVTRNGTRGDEKTGREAGHHANTLMRRWVEEDREAGRMPWVEYLARRYRAGFNPL